MKVNISWSKFSRFSRCPFNYNLYYLQRIPLPPNKHFVVGTMIHQLAYLLGNREFMEQDIKKLSDKELEDLVDKKWIHAINDNHYNATKEEEKEYKELGLEFCKNFIRRKNKGKVLAVKGNQGTTPALEQSITVPLFYYQGKRKRYLAEDSPEQIQLYGVIDRIEHNPKSGLTIEELKTAGRAWSQFRTDTDAQTVFYSILFREGIKNKYFSGLDVKKEDEIQYWIVDKKTGKIKIKHKEISDNRIHFTVERIWSFLAGIGYLLDKDSGTVKHVEEAVSFVQCSVEQICSMCDYSGICWEYAKR